MRAKHYFEAYLDSYDTINIYMSEKHYGGKSDFFSIAVNNIATYRLDIVNIEVMDNGYHHYTCKFRGVVDEKINYYIYNSHGRRTPLLFSGIYNDEKFKNKFISNGRLGSFVENNKTTFRVWSPISTNVSVLLYEKDVVTAFVMKREADGCFAITLDGDLHGTNYLYTFHNSGKLFQSPDPYGYASAPNSTFSVVVNDAKIKKTKVATKPLANKTDAIIYEVNIRDLTPKHTFKALCTDYKYILKDIVDLGVTHIQLMPILDYGSVDETNPRFIYNWGYDTCHWFTLEGSYSSDVYNPLQVIDDCQEFINLCHSMGLKVVCDVVYNHVFELKDSPYFMLAPYYFFQKDNNGNLSNASGCGNDIDSTQPMVARFIKDSVKHLIDYYDIDGLRFDLMGILNYDLINDIYTMAIKLKPDFLIYGEGWNMNSLLDSSKRASISNCFNTPNIGYFSDTFRDTIKGSLFGDYYTSGFVSNNIDLIYKASNVLLGSSQDFGFTKVFANASQAINYVECHDNMTIYDQYARFLHVEEEEVIERCKLALSFVILAQGIPFIHSGQEFARTKHGIGNSYDSGDIINHYDYKLRAAHMDMVSYLKCLIKIRKTYPHFRLSDSDIIGKAVYFNRIDDRVLIYRITLNGSVVEVFFNPDRNNYSYHYDHKVNVIFNNGSLCNHSNVNDIDIPAISTIITTYKLEK